MPIVVGTGDTRVERGLNPKDRLFSVLERREPDTVPIVLQSIISSKVQNEIVKLVGSLPSGGKPYMSAGIDMSVARQFQNRLLAGKSSSWKKEMATVVNAASKAPIDTRAYTKLGVDGFFYSSTPGDFRVLDENHIINEFGAIFRFGEANGELMEWYDGGYLKNAEQRDQWELRLPGPDRIRTYQRALKACGDTVYPIAFIVGIFELTWQSMGFTEWARNLRTNPGFVKRVYGEHARFVEELAKLFIDAGAEVIGIGDDIAYKNNLMASPKTWAEFVQPWAARIVKTIHKRGGLVFMHSDGYITPLIDLIIETEYDGVQSLEPLAGVNLAEVKKEFGGRIGLIGGIDTSQLLPYGSEGDVEKAVKSAIRAAAKGGGYAIGPCTEIHWQCKPGNVLAMIRCARKYGRYPLEK